MAVETLNVDTKASSFNWVRVISEKLDHESRRQWELDYPGKKLQTLDQLRDFINKRLKAYPIPRRKNELWVKVTGL